MRGFTFDAVAINQSRAGLRPFCSSWVFPAKGMNSEERRLIISGLLNLNSRSHWPLFHVHPIGCPFIIQRKIGLRSFCDSARACIKSKRQGIESHRSSFAVGITDATLASMSETEIANAARRASAIS